VYLVSFIIRIYHDARSDVYHCCVYSEKLLTWQGVDYKLPEDDTIVSKHVAV